MARTLCIIGAGGHGKVAADIALAADPEQRIVYFDDHKPVGEALLGGVVAGKVAELKAYVEDGGSVFVALGNNQQRKTMIQKLLQQGITITRLVHPSAILARGVSIGAGTLIAAGAVINPDTKIGLGCIINTNASVDHDCDIGDFVHIAPGNAIAGGVVIETGTFLGVGCRVIPGITIGEWSTIGAGAVVISAIEEHVTAVGMPAKVIKRHNI